MKLQSIITRIGCKRTLRNYIEKLIPQHEFYVEPFCGSAYVFFYSISNEIPSVLNDLDSELISMFKLLQRGLDADKFEPIYTKELMRDCYSKQNNGRPRFRKMFVDLLHKEDKSNELLYQLYSIKTSCTYSFTPYTNPNSLYRIPGRKRVNPTQNELDDFKDKLKNTELLSQPALSVMKKYDIEDCFMYLDPPYEKSGRFYKHNSNDNLFPILTFMSTCKSKVLLSYNDSKSVIDKAKELGLYTHIYFLKKSVGDSAIGRDRSELFVSNYPLPI